jgi:hypothetical protein
VQVPAAAGPQSVAFAAHSSTFVHVTPSPVKPAWHAQAREPGVFVQSA